MEFESGHHRISSVNTSDYLVGENAVCTLETAAGLSCF